MAHHYSDLPMAKLPISCESIVVCEAKKAMVSDSILPADNGNHQPIKTDLQTNIQADIHLTVKATTNLLSIEPLDLPEQDRESFITTFQYALERSIQNSL